MKYTIKKEYTDPAHAHRAVVEMEGDIALANVQEIEDFIARIDALVEIKPDVPTKDQADLQLHRLEKDMHEAEAALDPVSPHQLQKLKDITQTLRIDQKNFPAYLQSIFGQHVTSVTQLNSAEADKLIADLAAWAKNRGVSG